MFGLFKVQDYDQFKSAFDANDAVRKEHGVTGARLYRGQGNSNDVCVVTDWRSQEQAKKFRHSDELKQILQKAGIADTSDFYIVE